MFHQGDSKPTSTWDLPVTHQLKNKTLTLVVDMSLRL